MVRLSDPVCCLREAGLEQAPSLPFFGRVSLKAMPEHHQQREVVQDVSDGTGLKRRAHLSHPCQVAEFVHAW